MKTVGYRWPKSAPITDYAACCDTCGVRWRRSQLKLDAEGHLQCPDHRGGKTALELDRERAQRLRARVSARASRYKSAGPRGTFDKFTPEDE